MLTMPGYQTLEQIYESPHSLIYRARRDSDQAAVILKVLKEDYPSSTELTRYRQEYKITRSLSQTETPLPHIIQAYSLEKYHNTLVIVLEDFQGQSLKLLMTEHRFSFEQKLWLAVEITRGLAEIHQHQIIHKDINPSNIVLNIHTQTVKIIDFGISTALKRENTPPKNPTQLEGTLAYLSPEQTGRMNRILDYRTDFYALGVTLYEWFSGQLPFSSHDAMELVHCHLARQPVAPNTINPKLPPILSAIILKLLEKTAEQRYQSTTGLLADLEHCLKQWQAQHWIDDFALATQDISEQFQLPQKLYGRDSEIKQLLDTFQRICDGATELLLVAGYSGVGKSFLVNEVYKPLTEKKGHFIGGKFDQYQRNIPFSAFAQAFNALCTYLLTEPPARLAAWRNKILTAIGNNGQVLIEAIPRLELVLGPQPKVPAVTPQEAQNRFNRVLQQFLRAIGQQKHPLVLFIDDLQWADSASLSLLKLLMADPDSQHILLIGAFRDNEVNETHLLTTTLKDITSDKIQKITLPNLAYADVNQLIADTLLTTADLTTALTDLVFNKTQGNAFFTNVFLRSLYEEKLLNFNINYRQWEWDLNRIKDKKLTDNVIELMASKLQRFTEAARRELVLAACIGNQFNLETLAIISEQSVYQTLQHIWPAINEGLLVPLDNHYKLVQAAYETDLVDILAHQPLVQFRFQHDKVQQAAYSLIAPEERAPVHLTIGRLLFKNTPRNEQADHLFDITNHFNSGLSLIIEVEERIQVAELNLTAGRKAKATAAYAPALEYLRTGLSLIGVDSWQQHYDLMLALTEEAAEAAFLNTDFALMQTLAEQVLANAKTALDQVKIYEVLIQSHIAQSQPLAAVQAALKILALLGVPLPAKPRRWQVVLALWQTRWILSKYYIKNLIDLPPMTEPRYLAAMRIMASVSFASYYVVPDLFILISLKLVLLSLKHGNADTSAMAYASCGVVLCYVSGDIERGYQLGLLGLKILERFETAKFGAKTIFIFNNFIRHWKEPLANSLQPFQNTFHLGLETGDLETAALSGFLYTCHAYCAGQELTTVTEQGLQYQQVITHLKQEITLHRNAIYCQAALNLVGTPRDPCLLIGTVYNEQIMLPKQIEVNNKTVLFRFYSNKLILAYLFEQYQAAARYADLTQHYLAAGKALVIVPIFLFYDALTQLALITKASFLQRQRLLRRVKKNLHQLEYWAQFSPVNFLHKCRLIQAEYDRVLGRTEQARSAYESAIALAHEHDYIQEEALAYELAGRFYLALNFLPLAQFYLQSARYCYMRWGAQAKIQQLEAQYPQFLSGQHHHNSHFNRAASGSQESTVHLDLNTVLKASQTLAEEIVLGQLLEKLMKIVLENAGAQKGILLLNEQEEWRISAQASVESNDIVCAEAIPIEQLAVNQSLFPLSVVNYVIRTHEPIVLHHAWQEGDFIRDPVIAEQHILSILCIPLLNQSRISGVLYLENNLATGIFTPERLKTLTLLSAQMAISINNAHLYRSLAESETRLRIMAETTPVALMITRPLDGNILYANAQAGGLFNTPVENMLGRSIIPFYYDKAEREKLLDLFNQQGFIRDYEVRFHDGQGHFFWAGAFLTPFQYNNEEVLLSVFYNLTDRKRAEEERFLLIQEREAKNAALRLNAEIREQKEELSNTLAQLQATQQQLIESEKMAALGNLVAGVAHEINTPIGIGVTGVSQLELLSQELKSSFESGKMKRSDLSHYLNNAEQIQKLLIHNLRRAAELIQSFKKVAVDRSTEHQRQFQLADYLQEIVTSLKPEFRHLPHQIRIHCAPDIVMNSYPGLLSQVITNLILNSLQHAFTTNHIGFIKIQAFVKEGELHLMYSDNGEGMTDEVQHNIFEPFFTTNRDRGGSGLGLHIVYNLIRHQLGGTISCESQLHQGTRFIMQLPLVSQAADQAQRVSGFSSDGFFSAH